MTPPTQIIRINCVEAGLRVMLLMVARTPGQSVLTIGLCHLLPLAYAAQGVLWCAPFRRYPASSRFAAPARRRAAPRAAAVDPSRGLRVPASRLREFIGVFNCVYACWPV